MERTTQGVDPFMFLLLTNLCLFWL
uniref:Uncharacterized protein n=1 Tax=Arundo donax TaxID=35708 RepID=A0A0A8Y8E8_ARUDO